MASTGTATNKFDTIEDAALLERYIKLLQTHIGREPEIPVPKKKAGTTQMPFKHKAYKELSAESRPVSKQFNFSTADSAMSG
jgi:hypothetical protein